MAVTVQLAVVAKKTAAPLPCRITLLQAIPKGKLFESIIQKATELGASRIVPILAERVVTKLDDQDVHPPQYQTLRGRTDQDCYGGRATGKTDKWRQVAIEAIKQCGSPWLPRVESPLTPGQFLARGEKFDLPLVAALEGERRHPRECFREFFASHKHPAASACVWIGPEGDFTPAEMNRIKLAGALPISLGPRVLRTETAAAYCLSILNYELAT